MNIDTAVCLCLDKRWDERKVDLDNMAHRLENFGVRYRNFHICTKEVIDQYNGFDYYDIPSSKLENELRFWQYGRPNYKHHHWNALQCHKQIFREAIHEKCENLLMIEDDAYLTDRFEEIWPIVSEFLDKVQWDIVYLGWWIGNEGDEFNEQCEAQWKEGNVTVMPVKDGPTGRVGGLHGALIHKKMFHFLANLQNINPIDCQLNHLGIHQKMNTLVIIPKIIHTRSLYSYCEGSIIKRNPL